VIKSILGKRIIDKEKDGIKMVEIRKGNLIPYEHNKDENN
jgi:hypothetical protein